MADLEVELFSKEWCEAATELWMKEVVQLVADPPNFEYIVEWGETDTGTSSQLKSVPQGVPESWEPGQPFGDQVQFQLWASKDTWRKVAEGKLDPVGAMAAKRIHLRKGPIAVVIKEATAFKKLLTGFGQIPTAW